MSAQSIALLSHIASPLAPTGAEHSLALLAEGLQRRGHRVTVVAPGRWALQPTLRRAEVEVLTVRSRVCWLAYHAPRPWPVAALKWLRYGLPGGGRGRLRRILREWRPDVVHVNCLPHLRGAAAAVDCGLPVVWHLREILPPGARRRWFAAALRRRATRIVAVSEAVGRWVREERLEDRLRVVPNGVAPVEPIEAAAARHELGLPENGCLIGLLGQLLPHKGALEFVRAARLALRDRPGLRFLLAGQGPDRFVRRVRREIGEERGRLHLLPPQPSGGALVAACDVVCLATTTPDPFPRTVLEAMAGGRPVAGFRSGGTPEMVIEGSTGLLTEVGDVPGLARIFIRLGEDATLRVSLGAAGARRAREEFSVERHLDRMEQVFREAVSS